jgi:hypothetical protein
VKPKIPLPPGVVTESGLVDGTQMAPAISEARDRLRRVGYRMRSVDPVTTELIRIRNARFQNCFF